jgi:hypothetical protein
MRSERKAAGEWTPEEYRALLVAARRRQLVLTRDNLRRLMGTYNSAAKSIVAQIRAIDEGWWTDEHVIDNAQLQQLLGWIDKRLQDLTSDYRDLLDAGMLEIAQAAADRAQEVAELVWKRDIDPDLVAKLSQTWKLSDRTSVTVQFGYLAQRTVEGLAARYYSDGITLSTRIHNLTALGYKAVEDAIVQSVAEALGSTETAARVQRALAQGGEDSPGWVAMRIARTELIQAHRATTNAATVDKQTGELKPYLLGIGWALSAGHPKPDICDIYASHDSGLGPGVYLPDDVPISHPNCICSTYQVLKAAPNIYPPRMEPQANEVPTTQLDYYARHGDGPANAALDARPAEE